MSGDSQWQPIETATDVSKPVLGYQATRGDFEDQYGICYAFVHENGSALWLGAGGLMPTHWMPLPAPPAAL